MRSTSECQQMNLVYDLLRYAPPSYLRELRSQAMVKFLRTGCRYNHLLIYQIDETVRRKVAGIW